MTDRIRFDEGRSQIVDDCSDLGVEIRDLVLKLEPAAAERPHADPISGYDIALRVQVRTPRSRRAHELHPCHDAQLGAHAIRRGNYRIVNHLQGDASGRYGGLAKGNKHAPGLDYAIAAARRDGLLTREGGMGRILRIEIIALIALAPILPVGNRDLQYCNARLLKEA